jgi:hypothetical protein
MTAIYRPVFTDRDIHTILAALEMYENQTDGLEAQQEIYHATTAVAESVERAADTSSTITLTRSARR